MEHNLYMFSMGSTVSPVENCLLRYMTMVENCIVIVFTATQSCMNDRLLYISTNKSCFDQG